MEDRMIKMRFAIGLVVAAIWAAVSLPSWAENKEDAALLAKSLAEASVSLDQGLKASEREGTPISGKFEMEDGALQLSVYTMKGDKFSEVIVDHKSGAIEKAEPITKADDLKHAKAQSQAMAKAKVPLDKAVGDAVSANDGYRAVSVVTTVKSGTPVADIMLMKGDAVKKVSQKLN
jgi:hypothetical protein